MSFHGSFQARKQKEVWGSHKRSIGLLGNRWHLWIGQKAGDEEINVGWRLFKCITACTGGRKRVSRKNLSLLTGWSETTSPSNAISMDCTYTFDNLTNPIGEYQEIKFANVSTWTSEKVTRS